MNPTKELSKLDIIELIDTLELYLSLIKDDLPQLQEESQKISSTLLQLKSQNSKIDNIGKLLQSIEESFNSIKKELSQASTQTQTVKELKRDYHALKDRIIIAFALLGFIAGYAISHFLPF